MVQAIQQKIDSFLQAPSMNQKTGQILKYTFISVILESEILDPEYPTIDNGYFLVIW